MLWLCPHFFTLPSRIPVSNILITFFLNTLLFPAFAIFLMRKLELIQDIEMYEHKDRFIPLIAVMVFYIWCAVVSIKSKFPYAVQLLILGAVCVLVLSFIVTLYFKSSLHAAGISSALAFWILIFAYTQTDVLWLVMVWIILAGIIGTARLILKAHTIHELITGFSIGILGVLMGKLILSYIYAI